MLLTKTHMAAPTPQLNFNDTAIAYQAKSNKDLGRARLLYGVLQNPVISGPGQALLRWSVKLGLPVKPLIKATLYKQFIGGETREECAQLAQDLARYRVQTVLDYAAEGEESEEAFQKNLKEFKQNIDLAAEEASIPISVFKPSAISRNIDLITLSQKPASEWNTLEQAAYEQIAGRFDAIFSRAYQQQVPVMIDAEESWTQAIVDQLALTMMIRYNVDFPLVMNTYQLYRKDRLSVMQEHHQKATENGVYWGGKLVRGAYLEKERRAAQQEDRPSPIHETKEETDMAFDEAVAYAIRHVETCGAMIATHNEDSIQKAAQLMDEADIPRNHPHIWFSQLYGMADHLSFNLVEEGYQVAKYTPYGPVKSVVPYLIRRAEENSAVQGQVRAELDAVTSELKRRKNGHN